MVRTRDSILRTLERNRGALERFGVRSLGLFGSAARDEATSASDLDFLVELNPKSFDAYMGLREFLEGLFNCSVDLVLLDALKPRLRQTILEETVHAAGL